MIRTHRKHKILYGPDPTMPSGYVVMVRSINPRKGNKVVGSRDPFSDGQRPLQKHRQQTAIMATANSIIDDAQSPVSP